MKKYYDHYNDTYSKYTPDWFEDSNTKAADRYLQENSQSLINYIESYCEQFQKSLYGLKILDLGCGFGGVSLYLSKKGAFVTGIDIASLAISGAKEIAVRKMNCNEIDYRVDDICSSDKNHKYGDYDLIIDSHLLHCLTDDGDRKSYFDFVYNHLATEGLYLLESMVYNAAIQTPIGFHMDDHFILWQELEDKSELPVRKIVQSIDLENEIMQSGLTINYLYYHAELSFNVFSGYENYPHKYLPKTVRLSAVKADA